MSLADLAGWDGFILSIGPYGPWIQASVRPDLFRGNWRDWSSPWFWTKTFEATCKARSRKDFDVKTLRALQNHNVRVLIRANLIWSPKQWVLDVQSLATHDLDGMVQILYTGFFGWLPAPNKLLVPFWDPSGLPTISFSPSDWANDAPWASTALATPGKPCNGGQDVLGRPRGTGEIALETLEHNNVHQNGGVVQPSTESLLRFRPSCSCAWAWQDYMGHPGHHSIAQMPLTKKRNPHLTASSLPERHWCCRS